MNELNNDYAKAAELAEKMLEQALNVDLRECINACILSLLKVSKAFVGHMDDQNEKELFRNHILMTVDENIKAMISPSAPVQDSSTTLG